MTNSIRSFIYYISSKLNAIKELETILEIGSLPGPGQVELANLRPFFMNKKYIGIDKIPGINVDLVLDAENLTGIPNKSVNLVLCLEVIEHAEHPTRVASEIFRVLSDHGIIIFSTPMDAPIHMDEDYWRITPKGMKKILLYGYEDTAIYIQGEEMFPTNIIGIGSKSKFEFEIKLDELNSLLPFPYPFPFKKYL
jgi:SAM-dependent methyltransferase